MGTAGTPAMHCSESGLAVCGCSDLFIKERFIERGFGAERIVVFPDAVDLAHFEALPCKEACRQQLHLPLERSIIGYMGASRRWGWRRGF